MATKYTFNFSDTSKTEFDVQSYTTNGPVSPSDGSLMPHAASASTTLQLYGKGMPDYGLGIEQDLIYMLEKFADDTSPVFPIEGQDWWNNFTNELKIYNSVSWEAIIMASGVSSMTGNLNMGSTGSPAVFTNKIINLADPTSAQDAVTVAYADATYINVSGDTMTGALILPAGSPANVLGAISKQYADNRYIQVVGDTMTGVLTLSADPINLLEAATKQYVDFAITTVSDNYLNAISFENLPLGSPDITITASADTMIFSRTGTLPDLQVVGLDYDGKLKPAGQISVIPVGNILSTDGQSALEELDTEKLANTGDTMIGVLNMNSNTIDDVGTPISDFQAVNKAYVDSIVGVTETNPLNRIFLTDGTNNIYIVHEHLAGDNKLQLYVNGQKNYANTYGLEDMIYDSTVVSLSTLFEETWIDETVTDYNFDISINGGSPPINITLPASGSPSLTRDVTTHVDLISAINAQLTAASAPCVMEFSGINNAESFISNTTGTSSTVVVSNSGLGTYLYEIPSAFTIITINLAPGSPPSGSPFAIDSFELSGDQSSSFPVGKKFTVRESATDSSTNPDINGVYTVLSVTVGATTVIELEELISRDGTITTNGNIYLTHIAGLESLSSTSGANYDYEDLGEAGSPIESVDKGNVSTHIKFNSVPPVSQQVEIIKLP